MPDPTLLMAMLALLLVIGAFAGVLAGKTVTLQPICRRLRRMPRFTPKLG